MTHFMEAPEIKTVGEVLSVLQHFDPQLPIRSVDSGVIRKIRIYAGVTEFEDAKQYFVAIDGDEGIWQEKLQKELT